MKKREKMGKNKAKHVEQSNHILVISIYGNIVITA